MQYATLNNKNEPTISQMLPNQSSQSLDSSRRPNDSMDYDDETMSIGSFDSRTSSKMEGRRKKLIISRYVRTHFNIKTFAV